MQIAGIGNDRPNTPCLACGASSMRPQGHCPPRVGLHDPSGFKCGRRIARLRFYRGGLDEFKTRIPFFDFSRKERCEHFWIDRISQPRTKFTGQLQHVTSNLAGPMHEPQISCAPTRSIPGEIASEFFENDRFIGKLAELDVAEKTDGRIDTKVRLSRKIECWRSIEDKLREVWRDVKRFGKRLRVEI